MSGDYNRDILHRLNSFAVIMLGVNWTLVDFVNPVLVSP